MERSPGITGLSALLALISVLLTSAAHAQVSYRSYFDADLIALGIDTHARCLGSGCLPNERLHFHSAMNLTSGPNFGFLLGHRFNRYIAVEVDVAYASAQNSSDSSTVNNDGMDLTDILIPRLSARFDLPVGDDFTLFARYSGGGILSRYHLSNLSPRDLNLMERFYGPSFGMEYFRSSWAARKIGARFTAVPRTHGPETTVAVYALGVVFRW